MTKSELFMLPVWFLAGFGLGRIHRLIIDVFQQRGQK